MVTNRKVTGKAASMPVGLGMGLAVSVMMTLAGAALMAFLLSGGNMDESSIGYGAMIILLLSSVAGALVSAGSVKHRRLVVCLLAGVCYFAALLMVNILCFGGQFDGVGVTALLILGGCFGVAMLGTKGSGNRKRSKRKIRTG